MELTEVYTDCFVTIKIFARTEPTGQSLCNFSSFVTIKIFARTEPGDFVAYQRICFVTIKIFARTELYCIIFLA